jgi:hypothetical protein
MTGGIQETQQFLTMPFNAFPDIQATLEDIIAEGDRSRDPQGGSLPLHRPDNRVISGLIAGYRTAEGNVAEVRHHTALLGLMKSLGVRPHHERMTHCPLAKATLLKDAHPTAGGV